MTRVLITNDDGIDSPGLAALETVLDGIADVQRWTVAPDGGRSACSHGMTLHAPLYLRELGNRRFALSGSPADCVYFALYGLMDGPPDVVISGINTGPNLGSDVIYSGTVAGAREAAVRGVHGVAASLVGGSDFQTAAASAVAVALELAAVKTGSPQIINLNFPAGEFVAPTLGPLGRRIYPEQVERRSAPVSGRDYYWLGGPPVLDAQTPGTDGWLVAQGIASATYLQLDQTDLKSMDTSPVRCLLSGPASE